MQAFISKHRHAQARRGGHFGHHRWVSLGTSIAFACVGLICLLSVASAQTKVTAPLLAPFENKTYLPATSVSSLAQTADGLLWVGTPDGLLRYDGHAFERTRTSGSEERAPIRRLWVGDDRSLFVIPGAGDVAVWPTDGLNYELSNVVPAARSASVVVKLGNHGHQRDEWFVATPRVLAISSQPHGPLWLGTDAGVWRVDGDGQATSRFGTQQGLASSFVAALALDAQSALWVGSEGGLQSIVGDRVQPPLLTMPIVGLSANAHGDVLVRAQREMFWLHNGVITAKGPAGSHPALAWARAGGFWVVGSEQVDRITNVSGQLIVAETVDVPAATAVIEDREGNVWIGTRASGLVQRRPRRVWNIGAPNGLGGSAAFAVLPDRDGTQWVTTTAGLNHVFADHIDLYPNGVGPHQIPGWGLRGLARSQTGELFVWSMSHGLIVMRNETFTRAAQQDARLGQGLGAVYVDPKNNLWISTSAGDLLRYPNAELQTPEVFSAGSKACVQRAASFAFANDGLWFGTRGYGLGRIEGHQVTCHDAHGENGSPFANIASLLVLDDGSLWMGGQPNGGLVRFKHGHFSHIDLESGTDTVGAIVREGDSVWITTSDHGVLRTSLRALNEAAESEQHRLLEVQHWSSNEGMDNHVCTTWSQPAGALDAKSQFWVPTQLGVSVLQASRAPRQALPALRIERVWVNGRPFNELDRIGPGPLDLRIHLLMPTLMMSEPVRFSHRLHGRDKIWHAGMDRDLAWDQLLPGSYVLTVKASVGERKTSLSQSFVVLAPLWRRPWFIALVIVALICVVLAVMRLHDQQLKQRFAAVQQERLNLARDLHDGLAQGFASLGMLIDSLAMRSADAPEATKTLLQRTRHVLDAFAADARRTIWELRSPHHHSLTLAEAINKAVDTARLSADVRVAVLGTPPLTASALREVPLVVREAVTNAVRHGHANVIDVEVHATEAGVEVKVEDNGRGLRPTTADRPHFGLTGMQERAAKLGGHVTIGDGAAGGVTVTLILPQKATKP